MKLIVATPVAVVVEADDVRYIRADDDTGSFGILPGHADFITVLTVSVITWRNGDGKEHHAAVRGGVLSVESGARIEVATREAIAADDLPELEKTVLTRFRDEAAAEEGARLSATRLHLATIRQLQRYLEVGRQPIAGAFTGTLQRDQSLGEGDGP